MVARVIPDTGKNRFMISFSPDLVEAAQELEELRTRCESRAKAQAARRGSGSTTNDQVRSVSLNGATGKRSPATVDR
jgi:hypothetical protein